MNETNKRLDWGRLDELSDPALATLVESAIFVLRQSDAPGAPSPTEMPSGPMIKALEQGLDDHGSDAKIAGRVVRQPELSKPLAIALLGAIATEPALAAEVEHVWRERSGMLVVGTGTILAAALLLLVLKLKKVKVAKGTVDIDFDKVSSGALGRVFKFLG